MPNQTANITGGDIPPKYIPPIDGTLNYRYSVLRFLYFYSIEKAFTVTSEDKEERTMDRSGSETENASHPTNLPVGEIRNKKETVPEAGKVQGHHTR